MTFELTPIQQVIGIILFGGLDVYITIIRWNTDRRDKQAYPEYYRKVK